MGVTFKPVVNRLRIANKSKLYPIHIRVTIDRKSNYIKADIPKIPLSAWNGKQNKWVKESFPNSFEINSLLQRKLSELDNFILRQKLFGRDVTFESLSEFYQKHGQTTTFNDFVRDYIKTPQGFALNTIKVYKTFSKHLDSYNSSIKFKDLNEELLLGFKQYLQSEAGLKGGATKKYFDKFKKICKEAIKKKYLDISNNPFALTDLGIKVEKPKRTYLEVHEIQAIKELQLNGDPLEIHRDMFLFQIYTGLYYRDLKNLTREEIHRSQLGTYIVGNRIKNQNAFMIPLHKFKNAEVVLARYFDGKSHIVFPQAISDQKYNEKLKEIGEKAGISKNVTNKVARHTNAQLYIAGGAERQFVSRLLGHSDEETTQEYYDISIHDIDARLKTIDFDKFAI